MKVSWPVKRCETSSNEDELLVTKASLVCIISRSLRLVFALYRIFVHVQFMLRSLREVALSGKLSSGSLAF